ncbi:hypothetical protein KCU85_g7519, partial [Aureobasidium melanogenum]
MANHNKIPRPKTPEEQQDLNLNEKQNNPGQTKHIEQQFNGDGPTMDLFQRTITTKTLEPSLLSPFSPSNTELAGHDYMRSQVATALTARGIKFERATARARETTMHLAQIVRMGPMAVVNVEKEEGQIDSEDIAERQKIRKFKRSLKTLNKEYSDDSNLKVNAWINRYFHLGDDAVVVTNPGPKEHLNPAHIDSSARFRNPETAVNAPVSSSTVVPTTSRRVRRIEDLRAASGGT